MTGTGSVTQNGADGRALNLRIARRLEEVAQLLQSQGANLYRVQAYRRAVETLRQLSRSVEEIFRQGGEAGLRDLPGIGERLAHSIATLIMTGRLPLLNRLRGETDSASLLASVPGIGQQLARRLHDDLGIETLEQLEAAAHDGRLETIAGIGAKKLAGIIDSLATRLGRIRSPFNRDEAAQPSVAEILAIDSEYLDQAAAGSLYKIAPRRFNPQREAWLPILHTTKGRRHYSALFSNTLRAHQMGKTKDWVVIYCDDHTAEHQWTVITSQRGPLTGKRIVRGRENECLRYYQQGPASASPTDSTAASASGPPAQPTMVVG